jgi:hypothetical protein
MSLNPRWRDIVGGLAILAISGAFGGVSIPCFGQGQDIFALVQSGQVEKVREALKADPKLVNATGRTGLTPLFIAVSTRNLDMVRLLVDNGAAAQLQLSRKKADISMLRTADNPGDRFIVRKLTGPAVNADKPESSPTFSSFGRFLFFTRKTDIYWVSTKIIEELRSKYCVRSPHA